MKVFFVLAILSVFFAILGYDLIGKFGLLWGLGGLIAWVALESCDCENHTRE
jgi:hypothetical protein